MVFLGSEINLLRQVVVVIGHHDGQTIRGELTVER
jgi:hypothetical protein